MIAEGATFTLVTMGGGNVVAHYVPADAQLHVAYYQAGTGWIEAGRTAFSLYGGYAGAVDPRGNALTIWSEGTYSRYIPGSGWSEPEVLDLSLNYYTYAAYAFLDGSVAVVTNESITGGQVPVVLRFE